MYENARSPFSKSFFFSRFLLKENPFCHPNPCLNGGTCREEETEDPDKKEWWCECAKGYNGKYCNGKE